MKYFDRLPKVTYPMNYSDNVVTNLTVRAKIRDIVKNNFVVIWPYTVKEGERPDILSYNYYGTVNYAWVIFYANDIFDGLFEWPLDYANFNSYIVKKYGDLATPSQEIKYYYNLKKQIVDYDSYLELPENERSEISVYDWEVEENEKKREIKLLDNDFVYQIDSELTKLFR